MRKVVTNESPMALVGVNQLEKDKVHICFAKDTTKTSWILKFEKSGWIFRYTDAPGGMYGHFPTMREAVESSFRVGEVFEFDNHEEAFAYIAKWKTPLTKCENCGNIISQ